MRTDPASRKFDVLVVGAGHSGSQAAIAFRQNGFAGSIGLFGSEPDIPYERPPLSKEYLSREGLSLGYDETVLRGDPDRRSFSVVYLKKGEVIAIDCVNATKDFAQGRKLVHARSIVSSQALADTAISFKELFRQYGGME